VTAYLVTTSSNVVSIDADWVDTVAGALLLKVNDGHVVFAPGEWRMARPLNAKLTWSP
jgi:hypothetical protein